MDMIQQDHIRISIGIGLIHSDHIDIGMVVSVEPYSQEAYFVNAEPTDTPEHIWSCQSLREEAVQGVSKRVVARCI